MPFVFRAAAAAASHVLAIRKLTRAACWLGRPRPRVPPNCDCVLVEAVQPEESLMITPIMRDFKLGEVIFKLGRDEN